MGATECVNTYPTVYIYCTEAHYLSFYTYVKDHYNFESAGEWTELLVTDEGVNRSTRRNPPTTSPKIGNILEVDEFTTPTEDGTLAL